MASDIRACIRHWIDNYDKPGAGVDWDQVVITASGPSQKECFEKQINILCLSGELPASVEFIVVDDPPGPVIGDFGATLNTLRRLGHLAHKRRTLLIHSGGSSKRLPSCSCSGKLFQALPIEAGTASHRYALRVLHLKLMLTRPFAQFVTPGGLFITCSDDIETFSLDGLDEIRAELSTSGVVAVAHPSSVAIGETHGVYVVDGRPESEAVCWIARCGRVLQKPSRQLMERTGAIFRTGGGDECVYTDSTFWLGADVVERMRLFDAANDDVWTQETSVYGDLLVALGRRPSEEDTPAAADDVRAKIRNWFQDTPLQVVVLERSTFYHLGTMNEYVDNMRPGSGLFNDLSMTSVAACSGGVGVEGTAVHCLFRVGGVTVGRGAVVDHCIFDAPLAVGDGTIVSDCVVDDAGVGVLPAGWLLHTAPVRAWNTPTDAGFVTVAFRTDDDLKGRTGDSLAWNRYRRSQAPDERLWNARLFQPAPTMADALRATLRLVVDDDPAPLPPQSLSMADIVRFHDVEAFLRHRHVIRQGLAN